MHSLCSYWRLHIVAILDARVQQLDRKCFEQVLLGWLELFRAPFSVSNPVLQRNCRSRLVVKIILSSDWKYAAEMLPENSSKQDHYRVRQEYVCSSKIEISHQPMHALQTCWAEGREGHMQSAMSSVSYSMSVTGLQCTVYSTSRCEVILDFVRTCPFPHTSFEAKAWLNNLISMYSFRFSSTRRR